MAAADDLPPSTNVQPAPNRFPCPSCGAELRRGAILCPHCQTSLLTPSSSAPQAEAAQSIWEQPPGSNPWTSHYAGRAGAGAAASVVIGLACLVMRFILGAMSRNPELLQLAALLDWPVLLGGIGGLILARRASHRILETGDKRRYMLATLGTMIGWVNVGLVVVSFISWPIRSIFANLPE